MIFFDLEWIQVPDEAARPLIDSPALARYRHYLDQKRAWKPHYLTEPEEKILDEKGVTGRAAFVRLFEETDLVHPLSRSNVGRQDRIAEYATNALQALRLPTAPCARRRPTD